MSIGCPGHMDVCQSDFWVNKYEIGLGGSLERNGVIKGTLTSGVRYHTTEAKWHISKGLDYHQ